MTFKACTAARKQARAVVDGAFDADVVIAKLAADIDTIAEED